MKLWNHIVGLSALAAIFSAGLVAAQDQTAGVVRISDRSAAHHNTQRLSHSEEGTTAEDQILPAQTECNSCKGGGKHCQDGDNCPHCKYRRGGLGFFGGSGHGFYGKSGSGSGLFGGLFHRERTTHCYLCPITGELKCNKGTGLFGNKCRRHVPMTNAPFGKYKMAYPLDAFHRDPRDGSLYAAQGYGVNVSVPLAPTVAATYNYGWGVPSSRMTYISNPIPLPPIYEPVVPVYVEPLDEQVEEP